VNRTFRLPLLLAAFVISTSSFAQTSYREGYIVNNTGDTSKGWIDYRQWERNPNAIMFKRDLTGAQSQRFTVADLTSFEITGSDRYCRAIVNKDVRPVDLQLIAETDKDTTVVDTVFLRILLDTKISLYELIDSKPHYFIKENGKDYTELLYKVRIRGARTQTLPVFQDQLRNLLTAAGKDNNQAFVVRTNYKERDLVKAIEKVNKLIYGDTVSYTVPKDKNAVSFYVGGGITYSALKFSGDKRSGANLNYSNSFQPLFTGGVDLYPTRNKKIVLRIDLTWYSLKYKGSSSPSNADTITYNLKVKSFAPSLSVLYNLLNNPGGKLYVGAGFAFNLSSYPENDHMKKFAVAGNIQRTSPYLDFQKTWLSFHGKAGYIINKKIEIAVTTRIGGKFSNFSGVSLKPSIYCFGANYHF
jgi:hypothetical protein